MGSHGVGNGSVIELNLAEVMLFKMSLRLRVFMHRTLDCRYVNRTACQPVFIPRRVAVGDEQRYVTGVGTRVVHDVMIVTSKDLCHPQQTA